MGAVALECLSLSIRWPKAESGVFTQLSHLLTLDKDSPLIAYDC